MASLGLPVALSRAAGPDELEYVPAEATAVGYANVQEVMASELRQRLRKIEPDTRERDEFEAKTGVNIERDIDSVVGAILPTAAGNDRDHRPLVIARGRFDQVRIEGLAREHGGQITDYQGVRLLTHTGGDHDKPMALGFLEPGVLAVGSDDAVRAAIDAKRSGRSVLSNTDLMRLVNDLDASNAWAVGRFDALANQADLPDRAARQDSHAVVVLGRRPPERRHLGHGQGRGEGRRGGGEPARHAARRRGDGEAADRRQPGLKAVADSLQLGGEGPHGGGGVLGAGGSLRRPRRDAPEERAAARRRRPALSRGLPQRRTAGPRGPAVVVYGCDGRRRLRLLDAARRRAPR